MTTPGTRACKQSLWSLFQSYSAVEGIATTATTTPTTTPTAAGDGSAAPHGLAIKTVREPEFRSIVAAFATRENFGRFFGDTDDPLSVERAVAQLSSDAALSKLWQSMAEARAHGPAVSRQHDRLDDSAAGVVVGAMEDLLENDIAAASGAADAGRHRRGSAADRRRRSSANHTIVMSAGDASGAATHSITWAALSSVLFVYLHDTLRLAVDPAVLSAARAALPQPHAPPLDRTASPARRPSSVLGAQRHHTTGSNDQYDSGAPAAPRSVRPSIETCQASNGPAAFVSNSTRSTMHRSDSCRPLVRPEELRQQLDKTPLEAFRREKMRRMNGGSFAAGNRVDDDENSRSSSGDECGAEEPEGRRTIEIPVMEDDDDDDDGGDNNVCEEDAALIRTGGRKGTTRGGPPVTEPSPSSSPSSGGGDAAVTCRGAEVNNTTREDRTGSGCAAAASPPCPSSPHQRKGSGDAVNARGGTGKSGGAVEKRHHRDEDDVVVAAYAEQVRGREKREALLRRLATPKRTHAAAAVASPIKSGAATPTRRRVTPVRRRTPTTGGRRCTPTTTTTTTTTTAHTEGSFDGSPPQRRETPVQQQRAALPSPAEVRGSRQYSSKVEEDDGPAVVVAGFLPCTDNGSGGGGPIQDVGKPAPPPQRKRTQREAAVASAIRSLRLHGPCSSGRGGGGRGEEGEEGASSSDSHRTLPAPEALHPPKTVKQRRGEANVDGVARQNSLPLRDSLDAAHQPAVTHAHLPLAPPPPPSDSDSHSDDVRSPSPVLPLRRGGGQQQQQRATADASRDNASPPPRDPRHPRLAATGFASEGKYLKYTTPAAAAAAVRDAPPPALQQRHPSEANKPSRKPQHMANKHNRSASMNSGRRSRSGGGGAGAGRRGAAPMIIRTRGGALTGRRRRTTTTAAAAAQKDHRGSSSGGGATPNTAAGVNSTGAQQQPQRSPHELQLQQHLRRASVSSASSLSAEVPEGRRTTALAVETNGDIPTAPPPGDNATPNGDFDVDALTAKPPSADGRRHEEDGQGQERAAPPPPLDDAGRDALPPTAISHARDQRLQQQYNHPFPVVRTATAPSLSMTPCNAASPRDDASLPRPPPTTRESPMVTARRQFQEAVEAANDDDDDDDEAVLGAAAAAAAGHGHRQRRQQQREGRAHIDDGRQDTTGSPRNAPKPAAHTSPTAADGHAMTGGGGDCGGEASVLRQTVLLAGAAFSNRASYINRDAQTAQTMRGGGDPHQRQQYRDAGNSRGAAEGDNVGDFGGELPDTPRNKSCVPPQRQRDASPRLQRPATVLLATPPKQVYRRHDDDDDGRERLFMLPSSTPEAHAGSGGRGTAAALYYSIHNPVTPPSPAQPFSTPTDTALRLSPRGQRLSRQRATATLTSSSPQQPLSPPPRPPQRLSARARALSSRSRASWLPSGAAGEHAVEDWSNSARVATPPRVPLTRCRSSSVLLADTELQVSVLVSPRRTTTRMAGSTMERWSGSNNTYPTPPRPTAAAAAAATKSALTNEGRRAAWR